jgi:phosphate transport system substrate-binding protein
MGALVRAWEEGFHNAHPEFRAVRFENSLTGDASAIGGLYTGAAEIALIDRPPLAIEVDAYQQGAGHDPTGVAVATGSVATRHHAPALAIVVPSANPMRSITLEQLDAVFGADHRRGPIRVHSWGELGLKGEWADLPVHLYGFGINRVQSFLFEKAVMKESQKWREGLQEIADGSEDAPAKIAAAVAADPDGIGIVSMDGVNTGVRVLAVGEAAGDAVAPDEATLRAGRYPLQRTVYAYFNRDRKSGLEPAVKAFLEYVLSQQGQAVVKGNGYLPLAPGKAEQSLEEVRR